MWKWIKALNPFESDNYHPWMREEIVALRAELDAAEIELADKAFYVREFAAVSAERDGLKKRNDVQAEQLIRIDSEISPLMSEVAELKAERDAARAELAACMERAEQAPLGDEVIALRKQVSDLRSKHTETCVHNGQIAMLLAQAWEQIAKLGGDPITENALIEHIKAGRKRDMETVKQYAEEAGQLRNTITAIKAELKERRAEQAPMGDEIVNLRAELAALRERAAVPVPAGVPSVRDLREIGVHAYLSHDSAKRENAGCMVGPMGAAADAIRDAELRGAEQPSSNAGQFDDDEVEALARVLCRADACDELGEDSWDPTCLSACEAYRREARAAMDWMGAPVGECKECEKLRKRGDKLADDCVKLAGAIKNARAALADNPCR